MKTAAMNQALYPVYQNFKAYKDPDPIDTHSTAIITFRSLQTPQPTCSRCDTLYPFGDLTHKAAYTLELIWQLTLAFGIERLACYPPG